MGMNISKVGYGRVVRPCGTGLGVIGTVAYLTLPIQVGYGRGERYIFPENAPKRTPALLLISFYRAYTFLNSLH